MDRENEGKVCIRAYNFALKYILVRVAEHPADEINWENVFDFATQVALEQSESLCACPDCRWTLAGRKWKDIHQKNQVTSHVHLDFVASL
jgi:hypothetical protein